MSFYERAYELYYRIRQAGYSVPVDFQRQMEELERLQHQQFNLPRYVQPMLTPIEPKHIRRGGVPLRKRKLPPIESLKQVKDCYIPQHVNKLKQAKSKVSQVYIQPKIATANQDPLKPFDANGLIIRSSFRYQYARAKVNVLEQPKKTMIEDDTLLKPLIRTKRKSWGGVSRIYNLNVQDLTRLKRSILRRYKCPKLNHYETKGQDLKELTAKLRRGLSHIKYIADINLSDATPTAVYNMCFTHYYMELVANVFQQDIYEPMTKAQKRAFNSAWRQGHTSSEEIMRFMLIKLADYGGGDIRTSDPKAITRIVQGNNLAVRRCLANLKEVVTMGWEEYERETKREIDSRSTTQGAFLDSEQMAKDFNQDLIHMKDIQARK